MIKNEKFLKQFYKGQLDFEEIKKIYNQDCAEATEELKGKKCVLNEDGKNRYRLRKNNNDTFVIVKVMLGGMRYFDFGTFKNKVKIRSLDNKNYKMIVTMDSINIE